MQDTVLPLATDTLRWKRFVFAYKDYAIIYNMGDKQDWYHCDADSTKKTFTLHDSSDTATWHIFHYDYIGKDELQLIGKWKGNDVRIRMKSLSIDSMPLNKEKIVWLQD